MKRFLSYALTLAVLALPGHVRAQDDVTFHDGDQIKLANVDDAVVAAWGGVYLGPYTGQLVSDPTKPMFTMYCIDFEHEVTKGEVWTINESDVTGGDLSQTRLGDAGLGTYSQITYLASLFDSWDLLSGVSYDGNVSHTFASYFASHVSDKTYIWSGIHAAIWKLASGGTMPSNMVASGLATPFLKYAQMKSLSSFDGMDMSGWTILTPVTPTDRKSAQEMLVHTTATTVTPEPETYLLLGTGMLFLLGLSRRKQIGEIADV